VRSANVCRDDMRRHICRPIHARFVSSRVTRIERTQYATCDWNGLLRNMALPSLTIRRIDFLPIGNGSVHMSRGAYLYQAGLDQTDSVRSTDSVRPSTAVRPRGHEDIGTSA